ncbi:N-acetylmuramoyl-L-alanine amidase [Leeuwenhoekiella palythoae]
MQEKLAGLTKQNKRGVKFGDFQVLRDLSNRCPAVLVELGFINHHQQP